MLQLFNIKISYKQQKWADNSPNDYILSPDQFSDGSIRFIALATLLLQPEHTMPNVIIINEPELGLHPYAIGQLPVAECLVIHKLKMIWQYG